MPALHASVADIITEFKRLHVNMKRTLHLNANT